MSGGRRHRSGGIGRVNLNPLPWHPKLAARTNRVIASPSSSDEGEAIQGAFMAYSPWIASSLTLLAMTETASS
jgi:hypothetical protein